MVAAALRKKGVIRLKAMGGSMEPFISSGSVVQLRTAIADDVKVGDVVLVIGGDKAILHRAVSVRDGVVVTRGDALDAMDGVGADAQIVAVLDRIIHHDVTRVDAHHRSGDSRR